MIFSIIGILGSVLYLGGNVPYFRDIIRGKTKPQRVTWGIAFTVNAIGFANQYVVGAGNSLWLFAAATAATGAIFVASLVRGVGGHSKLDLFAIIVTMLGLVLWWAFDSPLLSIISMLLVAIVALIPTMIKAKKHPESETRISWLFGTISSFLGAVSVGEWNWMLLVLPVNATIVQAYIVYILYVEVKRHHEKVVTPVHGPAEPTEI